MFNGKCMFLNKFSKLMTKFSGNFFFFKLRSLFFQKFKNENYLTVNKKKHDMTLNIGLGSKGTTAFADQTPTPTQFIRNCEEVGLFQDLQKINPFEETFKKAAEAVKAGLPICLVISE